VIDLAKVRKGQRVRLADGRVVIVSGLYLSGTGPTLMVKDDASQTAAQNVPTEDVKEFVEA